MIKWVRLWGVQYILCTLIWISLGFWNDFWHFRTKNIRCFMLHTRTQTVLRDSTTSQLQASKEKHKKTDIEMSGEKIVRMLKWNYFIMQIKSTWMFISFSFFFWINTCILFWIIQWKIKTIKDYWTEEMATSIKDIVKNHLCEIMTWVYFFI